MKQQDFDKQLIRAIPIGELQESIKNFQRISPIDHKAVYVQEALQTYSENHLVLYESLQKQQTQVYCFMKQNRTAGGYFDQLRGKFVKIDYLSGKIIQQKQQSNSQILLNEGHLKQLQQIKKKLFSYLQIYYAGPYGAAFHYLVKDDKVTSIKVQFTSKNVSFYNFYTGQWISKWTFNSDNKYSSSIEIKNHFFEGGNILLERKKTFEGNIENYCDAQCIVKIIAQCQGHFQSELSKIYQDIATKGLKNLRKVTSFTQSKMNWNVNSVLLSRNLIDQSQKYQKAQNS